jgi:hypothetical protein
MSLGMAVSSGSPALSQLVLQAVPSGQAIDLLEVLIDEVDAEVWIRFRFLAPQIGKGRDGLDFAAVESDFPHLCAQVVLPYLQEFDLQPDVVVISMFDRPVEFGASDAEATQFIEAFRVSEGFCAWEVF